MRVAVVTEKNRRTLKLDTLLLLLLISAHLWFNPVNNALLVIGVATYVFLDLWFAEEEDPVHAEGYKSRFLFYVRLSIVFFAIASATLLPTGHNIMQRLSDGPATHAHDGLIQTEIAIEYLLEGKNPYSENYTDTPMGDFQGAEPPLTDAPLYHNAYLPFLFVSGIPLHLVSHALLGWYDQRLLYYLAFLGVLLLLPKLVAKRRDKLALLIAVGLNFMFAYHLADGRNDVMVLFELTLTTVLLSANRVRLSALVLGLALVTKHQAWLFLPFYLRYLLPHRIRRENVRQLWVQVWPLVIGVILFLIPFLIWDAASFVDDTILYLSGSGEASFPIKGWGISTLMLAAGLIPNPEASFPFIILELAVGLPILFIMLRRQGQNNTAQAMWFGYAIFAFAFQFFSRFFNDNYLVFLIQVVAIAVFMRPITYRSGQALPNLSSEKNEVADVPG